MSGGEFTREEIFSQPKAWEGALQSLNAQADALRAFLSDSDIDSVIFTGCGSTYYAALTAAASFQAITAISAQGLPASEVWLYGDSSLPRNGRVLLIPISRSGETSETLYACEAFRKRGGGRILTLTCYGDSALAHLGDLNVVLTDGQENSFAQTRAFTTLLLGTLYLGAMCGQRQDILDSLALLPPAAEKVLMGYYELARRYATDSRLDRFYFLGSGPRYGLACELSLKMKEMSLSHSEPFHVLEFRHGPPSMITSSTLIVGLISETNRSVEMAVLDDMRTRGAQIMAIAENDTEVALESGVAEIARSPLYLLVGQMLALERALHRQLDPDRPNNLDAVVRLGNASEQRKTP